MYWLEQSSSMSKDGNKSVRARQFVSKSKFYRGMRQQSEGNKKHPSLPDGIICLRGLFISARLGSILTRRYAEDLDRERIGRRDGCANMGLYRYELGTSNLNRSPSSTAEKKKLKRHGVTSAAPFHRELLKLAMSRGGRPRIQPRPGRFTNRQVRAILPPTARYEARI